MSTNTSTRHSLTGRVVNALAGALADRLYPNADAAAEAAGLTVVRLPDGGRRVYDPRLPDYAEARRRRMLRDGLDTADRAFLDAATAAVLRDTAARMTVEQAGREHLCADDCPATLDAPCQLSPAGVQRIEDYADQCCNREAWLPTPTVTAHRAAA